MLGPVLADAHYALAARRHAGNDERAKEQSAAAVGQHV